MLQLQHKTFVNSEKRVFYNVKQISINLNNTNLINLCSIIYFNGIRETVILWYKFKFIIIKYF